MNKKEKDFFDFEDGDFVYYGAEIYDLRVSDDRLYFIESKNVDPQEIKPVSIETDGYKFDIKYIMMTPYLHTCIIKTNYPAPLTFSVRDNIKEILDQLPIKTEEIKYIHQIQRLIKNEGYIVVFKTK